MKMKHKTRSAYTQWIGKLLLTVGISTLFMAAPSAFATDSYMTGEEITALIGTGKTINLGGADEGYVGSLEIKADGTALGSVKTGGGNLIIKGTWVVRQNNFCRNWVSLDGDKEVCESWKIIGDKRVEVQSNNKKMGVNWW
jgi:hypothetical protein